MSSSPPRFAVSPSYYGGASEDTTGVELLPAAATTTTTRPTLESLRAHNKRTSSRATTTTAAVTSSDDPAERQRLANYNPPSDIDVNYFKNELVRISFGNHYPMKHGREQVEGPRGVDSIIVKVDERGVFYPSGGASTCALCETSDGVTGAWVCCSASKAKELPMCYSAVLGSQQPPQSFVMHCASNPNIMWELTGQAYTASDERVLLFATEYEDHHGAVMVEVLRPEFASSLAVGSLLIWMEKSSHPPLRSCCAPPSCKKATATIPADTVISIFGGSNEKCDLPSRPAGGANNTAQLICDTTRQEWNACTFDIDALKEPKCKSRSVALMTGGLNVIVGLLLYLPALAISCGLVKRGGDLFSFVFVTAVGTLLILPVLVFASVQLGWNNSNMADVVVVDSSSAPSRLVSFKRLAPTFSSVEEGNLTCKWSGESLTKMTTIDASSMMLQNALLIVSLVTHCLAFMVPFYIDRGERKPGGRDLNKEEMQSILESVPRLKQRPAWAQRYDGYVYGPVVSTTG